MLLINSYFPTDPQSVNCDDSELLEILASIDKVINENNLDQIIRGGDINIDFLRKNGFVNTVNDFLSEKNFRKSWERFYADFTHTFEMKSIDHLFWNAGMDEFIEDPGVLHLMEKTSDNCPIFCFVNTDGLKL